MAELHPEPLGVVSTDSALPGEVSQTLRYPQCCGATEPRHERTELSHRDTSPGQVMLYPGDASETEILLAYEGNPCRLAAPAEVDQLLAKREETLERSPCAWAVSLSASAPNTNWPAVIRSEFPALVTSMRLVIARSFWNVRLAGAAER
jgi:hypothetical protein